LNKAIKALYEKVPFPVATVDKNAYITWANDAAKKRYPVLLSREGLRSAARFAEEREKLSRLVKENRGASFCLRQEEALLFTFTPLPEGGKELLLTVSDKPEANTPGGLLAVAVPHLREEVEHLFAGADNLFGGRKMSPAVQKNVTALCELLAELTNSVDHMELYQGLADYAPSYAIGNTAGYFRELLDAVCRLLGENAPKTSVKGHGWIVTDYPLITRMLLLLLANALEHGAGEAAVTLHTDEELSITVTNRLRQDVTFPAVDELTRDYVSVTNGDVNHRLGIGLPLVKKIVSLLGGSLTLAAENGRFTVSAVLPSAKIENPVPCGMKSAEEYLSARYGMLYTELGKFRA